MKNRPAAKMQDACPGIKVNILRNLLIILKFIKHLTYRINRPLGARYQIYLGAGPKNSIRSREIPISCDMSFKFTVSICMLTGYGISTLTASIPVTMISSRNT